MTTPSSAAPQGNRDTIDTGPLSWVMVEIREALNRSKKALFDALTQEPDTQATSFRHAKNYLHQAHGALQIVDVDGIAIITETVEGLFEQLESGELQLTADIAQVVGTAYQALLEYLEELLAGLPHQPVRLFPYYRSLLEVRGVEKIHPADLFFPNLSNKPQLPVAKSLDKAVDYVELRKRFERALLLFLRSADRDAESVNAGAIRDLLDEVESAQDNPQARAFWWVLAGFAEVVATGKAKSEDYVKKLLGRINLQIRQLSEGSTATPDALLRDALFFIAAADNSTPRVQQIRSSYQLDGLIPADYEKKRYGQVDTEALALAKERLSHAKNAWGRIAGGDNSVISAFESELNTVAEAGVKLNSPALLKLLREIGGISRHAAQGKASEALSIEMATSLLFVEIALQDINHLPDNFAERAEAMSARLASVVTGQKLPEAQDWVVEMLREAEQRQTMQVFATELQTSLRQVEKMLDEYFSDPSQRAGLSQISSTLHQIDGALAILDQEDAMLAVQHTQEAVQRFSESTSTPDVAEFHHVARNVGALSFFIDTLQLHSGDAKKRFSFNKETGVFHANLLERQTATPVVQEDVSQAAEPVVTSATASAPVEKAEAIAAPTVTIEPPVSEKEPEPVVSQPLSQLSIDLPLEALVDEEISAAPVETEQEISLPFIGDIDLALDDVADTTAQTPVEESVSTDVPEIPEEAVPDLPVVQAPVELIAAQAPATAVPQSVMAHGDDAESEISAAENTEADDAIDAELLEIFLTEAVEVLACVRETIPQSRNAPYSQDHLTTLRRSFHTLKGSGRMVGLMAFGEAAWSIEQLLNARLSETRAGDANLYALLEKAAEVLGEWVDDLQTSGKSSRTPTALVQAADRLRAGLPFSYDTAVSSDEPVNSEVADTAAESEPEAQEELQQEQPEEPVDEVINIVSLAEPEAELDNPVAAEDTPEADESIDLILPAEAFDDVADAEFKSALAALPQADDDNLQDDFALDMSLPDDDAIHVIDMDHVNDGDVTDDVSATAQDESEESNTDDSALPVAETGIETESIHTDDIIDLITDDSHDGVPDVEIDPEVVSRYVKQDDSVKVIGDLEISLPLFNIYLAETDELVRLLSQDIGEWRHEPDRHVNVHVVHAAHSLAGTSATVGFKALQEVAYALEMILQYLARKPARLISEEYDTLEHGIERIRFMLQMFALGEMPEHEPQQVQILLGMQAEIEARLHLEHEGAISLKSSNVPPQNVESLDKTTESVADSEEVRDEQEAEPASEDEQFESESEVQADAELTTDSDKDIIDLELPDDSNDLIDVTEVDEIINLDDFTDSEDVLDSSSVQSDEDDVSQTQSLTETVSETETQTESQSQSETETQTESQTESETQSQAETQEQSESQTQTETQSQTETETQSESQTESETQSQVETEEQSETQTQTETQSQSETETQTESQIESETQSQSETQEQSESQTQTETQSQSETETQTESQTESETQSQSETQEQSESQTQTETQSQSETETQTESQTKSETQSQVATEEQSESQTQSETQSQTETETQSESQTESETQSQVETEEQFEAETQTELPSESVEESQSETQSSSSEQTQSTTQFDTDESLEQLSDSADFSAVEEPERVAESTTVSVEQEQSSQLDEPVSTPEQLMPVAETAAFVPQAPVASAEKKFTVQEENPTEVVIKDDLDADLLPVFIEEGQEMLPQLGQELRNWQSNPTDTQAQQAILRLLHTLKGSARMAGAMVLGQHMHEMETRIEHMRSNALNQIALEEILSRYDHGLELFEDLVNPQAKEKRIAAAAAASEPVSTTSTQAPARGMVELTSVIPMQTGNVPALRQAPVVAANKPVVPAVQAPLVRVRADILDRLVNQAGEVSITRSKLETEVDTLRQSLTEMTENIARLRSQLREIEIQAETQITSRMSLSSDREFDPLEFDRFTRLQELTRIMAESVNDVGSVQQNIARTVDNASNDLTMQARLTRDLQQDLMRVRMVQFASISERLFAVTRQASKEVNKRVNLDIRGSAVEMDRSVLEKMTGPFEHLLRNAIVHGIETRDRRQAAGKNDIGELLVEIRQEGNEVVIQFTDDGQGLSLERIRNKARQTGLLGEEDVSDADVVDMIFHPGFSTAEQVTELAGRGVGMDVVRSEAAALGGRVSVVSEPGKGAQFTIHLPLTLAVTQVVILTSAGKTYAVPSVLVEQVQQLKTNPLAAAYNDGAVMWRNQRVPMHYLAGLLGDKDAAPVTQQYSPIIILKSGNDRVAIHVDEIIGNREVVVKNIGPQLARMIGIAGATVLGSGEIVLILNPIPLAHRVAHEGIRAPRLTPADIPDDMGAVAHIHHTPAERAKVEPVQGLRTQHIVMVVDDSLTVRRVTQRLLAREGYQVVLAKDGVDALEHLQSITPDVMLVDIEMPRMDGFDLTRNVRGDERTRHIPIIMITSRTATKHRNYATELGVNEYLGKPYQEDTLIKLISGFVKKEVPV